MATIEEARSALANRLGQYKKQTPVRVAFLGDGRGNAASNMVPPGEPDKYWARESIDGDKPFKVINRSPNFTPAFNLPVLLGYPEDDPDQEQVMGIHRGLVQFSIGNAGSAISGTAPHHTKHEWGGGDEVYVDPRMFKPGLIKPTSPASMYVKVLAFQHYYNTWQRYDGGTSPNLAQYVPASDYRYVLLTLDPDTNQLCVRPGSVFTPDLSIDSIISNQATNTFRHIPTPPGNEIPLGVALLEPGTTKIDWNTNGVNNLLPMRVLLSSPTREINERLSLLESATGVSSLPSTGAANSIQSDLLPARIDGNITRIVLNRNSTSAALPTLFVGELGFVNNSPVQLVLGTASGNAVFSSGGGASVLDDLADVRIEDLLGNRAFMFDSGANIWTSTSVLTVPVLSGIGYIFNETQTGIYTKNVPLIVYDGGFNEILTVGYAGESGQLEYNPSQADNRFIFWNSSGISAEFDSNTNTARLATINSPSAIDIQYDSDKVLLNSQSGTMAELDATNDLFRFATESSPSALAINYANNNIAFAVDNVRFETTNASCALGINYAEDSIIVASGVNLYKFGTSNVDGDSFVFFAGGHGFHVGGSPTPSSIVERLTLHEVDLRGLVMSSRSRQSGGGELFRFVKYGRNPSLPVDTSYMIETVNQIDPTTSSEDAEWTIQTRVAGTMGSRLRIGVSETEINGARADHDTKIATSANASMFVVDSGLGAVQIGTSAAGQIADFRDHLIEFNKNQNDIDTVIRTSGNASMFVVDAGNNRIGIGTATPGFDLELRKDTNGLTAFQITNNTVGTDSLAQYRLATGSSAYAIGLASSAISGALGDYAGYGFFDANSFMTGLAIAATATNGVVDIRTGGRNLSNRKVIVGNGIQVGTPTGGDKGVGTINVSGNVYKNNSLYNNPDYAFFNYFHGHNGPFSNNPGAREYAGLLPIDQLKEYVSKTYHLPGRNDNEPMGIFDMADIAQQWIEELSLYIIELNDRVRHMESLLLDKGIVINKR
jgi:hypothetical protein